MLDSQDSAAPFYPPRIQPAKRPLRFPHNLIKLVHNNLEVIPEQAYDEPIVIAAGPPTMAFLTGPDAVKSLLHTRQSEFPKGEAQNRSLEPLFGRPMISAEGHDWRWQRGVAAPLFRHEELLHYGPIMTASAEATVEAWRAAPRGEWRLINRDMLRAAFRIISSTMLVGGAEDVIAAIEQGHADYFSNANWWIMYSVLGLPSWLPRPGGRAMRAQEVRMRKAVTAIVTTRRAGGAGGNDLMGRMLAAHDPETGQRMSDRLLVDNILSFLVAGYDTTALSLTWTLYLLSQSPKWEARILQEVERVVGSGPVGSEHFCELVVTQQVYNEALRLYPTAPIIVRDIRKDVEIEGVPLGAGTIAVVPIYAVHRHRRYWTDPDRFDPCRFAPDSAAKRPRYQFLPFGAGPRICIGAAFATLEATIMLATFVRAARFEVARGFCPLPSGQLFLFPKNGMPMRVTMRR
jgi:cytochrome P450